jgi:hypothetical protein
MEANSMNNAVAVLEVVARRGARILSVIILLFWGVFLTAHLLGDAGDPARTLTSSDYIVLGTLITSLLGLALAWRWQIAGATTSLLAISVCAAVNWKVVVFPGVLIPTDAVLFLSSWALGQARSGSERRGELSSSSQPRRS